MYQVPCQGLKSIKKIDLNDSHFIDEESITQRLSNSSKSHSKKVTELGLPPSPKPSMDRARQGLAPVRQVFS